jgi:excinuclease ABC subunit C
MTGPRKPNDDPISRLPSDDEQDVAGIIMGDAENDDDDDAI